VKPGRTLRVLLDIHVLVSDVLSRVRGRRGTASQKLMDAALAGQLGETTIQLIISIPMLDRFHDVLVRLGAESKAAEAARLALIDLVRSGPDGLDPYLLLDRSDISFAVGDAEDASVLAAAFAARADLLITDNLADFAGAGGDITNTSVARHSDGRLRQLTRQVLRAPSGHCLIILHPLELLADAGLELPPGKDVT
jgi:predicted nucleic acid-binding protein